MTKGIGSVLMGGGALAVVVSCAPAERPCPTPPTASPAESDRGYALEFCGTGTDRIDRVTVRVDDPLSGAPGPPLDVGAGDFTIEWWMKSDQTTRDGAVVCGANLNWINGNVLIDRDRYNQGRKYGVSLAGGRIAFGVSGRDDDHLTLCGTADVADGSWHHVAVQRRRADGQMTVYVDGRLDAQGLGPEGDVSYPDEGVPGAFCNGRCFDSDPYLVLGAEKHDAGSAYPSYRGWLDEMRVSTTLRYEGPFEPPTTRFVVDGSTAALWHFDEGSGHVLIDSSPHGSHGLIRVGGPAEAPRWRVSDAPLDPPTESGSPEGDL